ncbi:hypothetical protein BX616_004047 [Lobosporangium transversale]|uniref:Metallo-dependent phosphatase-like protein n=1 Tax=Lobosporangium transversale TaxID=64571 RepID=A0A1Y2GG59_9FUNG|nr:Metallo-dependent phosphatase-like protein [Lobosporangium transversale]KAF9916320.1 hypothetical protein BX616_004047 [Lobosporangium transversale]ORZ09999.1 Metallo-dependent phosphatase-like protein [Lobosporangium transversale]|eukprot:XP_021879089.1 Metallo-dependent phosphatase-like protein [Lobosporangium transversale]
MHLKSLLTALLLVTSATTLASPVTLADLPASQQDSAGLRSPKQPNTPPESLPSDPYARYNYRKVVSSQELRPQKGRRTIIVGDIHGGLVGFNGFLKDIKFKRGKDRLILVGDIVSKGPYSLEVINKARALKAKCVRGNHDDKVIRWRGYLDSLSPSEKKLLEEESKSKSEGDIPNLPNYPSDLILNSEHHKLAMTMNKKQYEYLLSCPLILSLPPELSLNKIPIHVVHAGIDPRHSLDKQEPWVLVNIRNIREDGTPLRKAKKGRAWVDQYNDEQNSRDTDGKPDSLIVYGHNASRNLNVKPWTVGIDTGCVYGRALTGYVVETNRILSVPCPVQVDENESD